MKEGPDIAGIATLIGDPARANMLTALMSGRALTARELAGEAGVTAQTASSHLAKLAAGGLIAVTKEGRHKYVRLASDEVATTLEALLGLALATGHMRTRTGPRDQALRQARVCYSHLAGQCGVRLYDSMVARGMLGLGPGGVALTGPGRDFVSAFGVDLPALETGRAALCRNCLDWSVRRYHLGGALGRALLAEVERKGWARRADGRVTAFWESGPRASDAAFPL